MKKFKRFTREEINLLNRMKELKGGSNTSPVWKEYHLICAYFWPVLPIDYDETRKQHGVTIEDIRAAKDAKNIHDE